MLLWLDTTTPTSKHMITTPLWYKVVTTLHLKPMSKPTVVVDMVTNWDEEFARS